MCLDCLTERRDGVKAVPRAEPGEPTVSGRDVGHFITVDDVEYLGAYGIACGKESATATSHDNELVVHLHS